MFYRQIAKRGINTSLHLIAENAFKLNGSMAIVNGLIDLAAHLGFGAVKFQKPTIDNSIQRIAP